MVKQRDQIHSGSEVVGNLTGTIVRDQVCLDEYDACIKQLDFYTVGKEWETYNVLGLAPKSAYKAPDLIRELDARGLISEQRATIEFNPIAFKALTSRVVFGPIKNNMAVNNEWHNHELLSSFPEGVDTVQMLLKVSKMSYDGTVLRDGLKGGAILSSTEYNMLILSEEQKEVFTGWSREMEKIPGVSC